MSLAAFLTSVAMAEGTKRIMILNPYSRGVEPFSAAISGFRSTLGREYGQPVDFQEIPLDLARTGGAAGEEPLVAFLADRIQREPVDLVVPFGSAGVQFVERHRERLFKEAQILAVAAEPRVISGEFLQRNATYVSQQANLPGFVEDILRLQPETETIAVVIGASPLERFWAGECRREFKRFEDRVRFLWLDDLPFEAAIDKCSKLPPRSFILHVFFLTDVAGVACEQNEALKRLHRSANAPVFAIFESELGTGSVGGHLLENTGMGVRGARIAGQILGGRNAGDIPPQRLQTSVARYDWRELRRWNIPESRLPAGSVVLFREPGFWEHYRWPVIGLLSFSLVESALIAALLVYRGRRVRGEQEAALVAEISSKFVNLPGADVDREIIEAQGRICRFSDLDASVLWQVGDQDAMNFVATHVFPPPSGTPAARPFRQEDFPWVRGEMIAGRIVVFTKIEQMPAEAARDKELARAAGIRSSLTMPLSVGGKQALGVLCFNTLRAERKWPESLVKRLQLVAQIFANALARKRAEQALRESELRLSLATDAAAAGLWVLEWGTGEFWTNEVARSLFGYGADEVIDMARFEASVFPEDWTRVKESISNSIRTGEPVDVEYRIRLREGNVKWIVSRGRPFYKDSGEPDRMVGLSLDITGQRQAESEARELRDALAHSGRVGLLGHLASALAHELSQPLGAILRNAEAAEIMLAETTPDMEELRAIIADILRDDQRAGQVINRLRSLLKRGSLDLRPVDLRETTEEVLSLLRADAAAHHVQLESVIAPGLPMVQGDRIHLQQVLMNLVINAIDAFAGNGKEEARIHLGARACDAATIEVEVADNGPGIPGEVLDHLFEPFFTTKSQGMGIGLTISKTIVEAHRGKLWAMNDPQGGARFLFTIPVAAGESIPAAAR